MSRIRFHIVFFIFWLITLAISFAFNIGFMGNFFGALVAIATDPVVLFFGILCGLLFSDFKKFLFALLLFALAVNLLVEFLLFDWHSVIGYSITTPNLFFNVFVRTIALLMLAVFSNIIRLNFLALSKKFVSIKNILYYKTKALIAIALFFIIFLPTLFIFYNPEITKLTCNGEKIFVEKATYQSFFTPLSHINCPPKIIDGQQITDVDCLLSQKRPEEFTSKSIFSGSLVFTQYLKFFGVSLLLIDANEKNNLLTEFPRNECKFESEANVSCNNQFGSGTAKIKFDISSSKLDAFVSYGNDKIYYDLVCNKPYKN
jgi:hypothetical protein